MNKSNVRICRIRQRGTSFWKKRAAVLFVVFFFTVLTGCQGDQALTLDAIKNWGDDGQTVLGSGESQGENGLYGQTGTEDADGVAEKAQEVIFVHVCGAVNQPGIQELPAGSRACDALERAGGFTGDADQDYVNLAAILSDGQKLYFPTKEESSEMAVMEEQADKVNLNTADEDRLCTLPGIGSSRAKAILKYRREHGKFESVEEILQVPGIKDALYEQIRDLITVT